MQQMSTTGTGQCSSAVVCVVVMSLETVRRRGAPYFLFKTSVKEA